MGSKVHFVGVDDGYAETKIVLPDGTRFRMASQARAGEVRDIAIQKTDSKTVCEYQTPEGVFAAGELEESDATAFDAYPTSAMNRVVVTHALRRAGITNGDDVAIATGLPVRRYYLSQDKNVTLIGDKKKNLLKNDVTAKDGSAVPKIVSHEVLAEGVAAWIDYVMSRDASGKLKEDPKLVKERIGIVDIGGRTTDIAVVSNWNMKADRASTIDSGMIAIREAVREMLQDQFDVQINEGQLLQAMNTGSLKMWGKPHDASAAIEQAQRSVVNRIKTETLRCLGKGADLDQVIFVGGTVMALGNKLSDWFPNQSLGKDPAFANARGLQKCAEYLRG